MDATKLSVGDYLPPLDDGRVEIPTPTDWSPLSRNADFVVRFYRADKNGLPRMEMTVQEKALGDLASASEQNVVEFAKHFAAELAAEKKKLTEDVLPIMLGSIACARYVTKVELKQSNTSIIAERQTLVTARENRVYTLELTVLPGTLLNHRDAAYAVFAGLKFVEQ